MKTLLDQSVVNRDSEEDALPVLLQSGTGQSNSALASRALQVRAARAQRASEEPQQQAEQSVAQEPEQQVAQQEPEQQAEQQAPEQQVAQQEPEQQVAQQAPEQQVAQQEPEQQVAQQAPEQQVAQSPEPAQEQQDEDQVEAPPPRQEVAQVAEEQVVVEQAAQQEEQPIEPVALVGAEQAQGGGQDNNDAEELLPDPVQARAEVQVMSEVDLAWSIYRDAYLAYKTACARKDELRRSMKVKKLAKIEKKAKDRLKYLAKHPTHDDGRFARDAREALALIERARLQKEQTRQNLAGADAQLKRVLGNVANELRTQKKNLTKEQSLASAQIGRLKKAADQLARELSNFTPENIESGGARLRLLSDEIDALRLHIAAACETLDAKSTGLADVQVERRHMAEVQRNRGRMERLEKHVAITEVGFAGLQKIISPMLGGDTGSMSLGLSVGVTGGVEIGSGIATAGASLSIDYSANLSIQDDRKFRVAHKLSLSPTLKAQLGPVVEAQVSGALFAATSESYLDERHWAAHVSHRIGKAFAAVAAGLQGNKAFHKKVRREDIEFAQSMGVDQQMMEILHLNQKRPGQTRTGGANLGASAKVVSTLGASGGVAAQAQHFTDDKGRTKTGTQWSWNAGAELGPFKFTVTYTDIDGHANPDNDGKYLNFNFGIAGGFLAKLMQKDAGEAPQVLDNVGQWLESQGVPASEEDLPGWVEQVKGFLGALDVTKSIPDALPFAMDVGVNGSAGREWNFVHVDGHGKRLQYARNYGGLSAKVAASIPTSVPGLTVDLGANYGHTKADGEVLGTQTVTYLMTVYNGLSARDAVYRQAGSQDPALIRQWAGYADAHRAEISQMCRNLAAGSGSLGSELDKCEKPELVQELRELASGSFAGKEDAEIEDSTFRQAVDVLGRIFDDLTRQNKEGQDWNTPKEKPTSDVGSLTVRLVQGPWANIDSLRRTSTRAPDMAWWLLGTMLDTEIGADESARTNAWRTGGAGPRARDIRALLDKGFLVKVLLPQAGSVTLTAATGESALEELLTPLVSERLTAVAPQLAASSQQREQVIKDIVTAILTAEAGFEVPRPLLG